MEMDVVAQLQKERLQTLTERRSRQEDIENKKRALEDEKLNLQHFKTKVLRERWLLEGAPAGSAEEQAAVKNQLAENEQRSKQLEETIHRLEAEIDRGECEEAELKAKEKGLLQRLRDAEAAVKDAATASSTAGADEVKYVYSEVGAIPQQLLAKVAATGDSNAALMKPMSLTISVHKDPVTGETRVVSTGTVSGDATQLGGTKVFDDGRKVVYAVRSGGGGDGGGGGGPAENGVPQLTEAELQEILAKSVGEAAFLQSSAPGDAVGGDAPVTMVFAGYERSSTGVGAGGVGITTEGRSDCSSEGAVRAELVMIDEEGDDVSLREKTVTDPSPADGSAAELVASSPRKHEAGGGGGTGGGPADDATEAPSSAHDAGGWSHVLVQANGMSPWSGSQSDGPEALEYSIHAESIERSTRPLPPRNEPGVRPDASRAGAAREETMEGSPMHPDAASSSSSSSEPRPQLPAAAAAAAPSVDAARPNGGAAATSPAPRLLNGLDFAEDTVLVAKQIMVTDDDDDDDDECDREDGAALTADVAAAGGDAETTRARGTPPTPAARVGDETPLPGPGPLARAAGAGGRSSEARFEIKACKEERKPSKLFSDDDDGGGGDGHSEGGYRLCRKARRDEEKQGLEMERQALIRSQAKRSVAGSLSGGVASVARAWNPPQEATLEDTLHESQLESLRRYQERKQKQQQQRWGGHVTSAEQRTKTAEGTEPDAASPPYRKQVTKSVSQPAISAAVAPQPQPRVKNENVEVAPVDFAMARRQFLMMERASHLQSSLPYPIRRRASVDQSLTPQSLGSIPPSPRTASPQSPRSTSQSPIFPAHAAQRPQVSPSFIFSHASLPPSHAPGFPPAHATNAAQQQQSPGSARLPPCSARPATPESPAVVATHATLPSPQSPGFVSLATGFLPTQFPGFTLARPAKSVAEAAVQTDTEELSEEQGGGGQPPATEPSRAEAAGDESEGRVPERDVGVEAEVGQVASTECARSESGEQEAPGKEEQEGGERVEPVMMAFVDVINELDVEHQDVVENSSQQIAQKCQAGIDAESRPTASTCGDIEMDNADQTKEPTVSTEPSLKALHDSVDNEKKIISPQGAAAGDQQWESTAELAVLIHEVGALHVMNGASEGEGKKTTGLEAPLPATAVSAPEAAQLPSEGDYAEPPSKRSAPREEAAVLSDERERADNAAPKSSEVNLADKPTEPPGSSTEQSDGQDNKEQLLDATRQGDNTTGITCVEECTAEAAEGGNKTDVGERPEGTMCLPDGLANVEPSLEKDRGSLAFSQTQDGLDDSSAEVSGEAGREDCVVEQEAVEIEIVDGEAGDDAATGDADSESDRLSESRGGSAVKFSDLEEDGGGSGGGGRFADVDDGRESVEAVAAEMVRAMVAKAVEMMNATATSEDNRDGKPLEVAAAEAEWEPTTEDYTLASETSESLLAGQTSLDASESADCFSGIADRETMSVIVIGSVNAVGPKGEVRVLDEALVFATGELDSGVESIATKTPDGDNNTVGLTSTELSLVTDFCDTPNETPSISADVTPDVEKVPMLFISVSDENNQIIEQEMIVSSLLNEQRKHTTGRKAPSDKTAEPVTRTGSVEVKASSPGFQNVNGSDESLNEDFGADELQIEDVVKDLQDTVAFEEGRQADVERSLAQDGKRVDVAVPSVAEHKQVDSGTPSVEEGEQVKVVMPLVLAHTQVDHDTTSFEEGEQVNVQTPSVEEGEQVTVETPSVEEGKQVGVETPSVEEGEQVNVQTPSVEEGEQVGVETPSVEEGKHVNVQSPSVEEGEQVGVETPSVEEGKQVNVQTPSVEEGEQVNVQTPSVEEGEQVGVETPSVEEGEQVGVETPSVEEGKQVNVQTPSVKEGEQVGVEAPSVEEGEQVGVETRSVEEGEQVGVETPSVEEGEQVGVEAPSVEEHTQVDPEKPSVASSIETEQSTDIDVSVQERDPVASSAEQQTPKPCAEEKDQDGEEKSTDRDNEINLRKERVEMCKGNASMPDEWQKNAALPTEPGGARRGAAIVVIVDNSTDRDDETNREGERAELLADAAPPDDEDGAAVGLEAAWPRDRDAAVAAMRELVTPPTPPPSEASVTETAVQTDAEDFPEELEGFESSVGLAYAYAAMNDFDVGAWRAANEVANRALDAERQPAGSRSVEGPGEFDEAMAEVVTSATLEEKVVGEEVLRERALRQSAPEDVVSVEDRPTDAYAEPSENGHAAEDDEVAAAAERGGEEHGAGESHEDKAGGDEVHSARPAQHPQGPCFRLRPRKQNTLSMIEQEIRESQEREEELRAQRRSLYSSDDGSCPSPSPPPAASPAPDEATKGPATEAAPKPTPEVSQQHKTGPGRIERVKPATARTLEEAEEQAPAESDKRGKGLMQSLVKDYDKVKLREKKEDPLYAGILAADEVASEVVEVTRVTRRKSAKAMRWEAGIYTNHAEDED
uniref:Uncharacterized protein LOC116951993 isoform X3 n=1 Tax=Petromyzon marinus TaxID=7757 RepID=A0AAJ7U1C3_PETMA|nr:uncharacterized protein LOC116951993 isoform X3 [Petromyzon marinus]XP_032826845.1 uncharacterized protein LOC116951993 isoform X4 [Petromyzon marinus]